MTSPKTLSVAVFEDDRATCHGLRDLLNETPGFRCVLAALSLQNALARVDRCAPDVVILDIQFPGGSGLAALTELRKARPDQKVLMHTAMDSGDEVLLAFLLGASGYLLKGDGRPRLLGAIEIVAEGGAIFSPSIAWMFRQMTAGAHSAGWVLELTTAELEVLQLLSEGRIAKEVAALRSTTEGTINKQCEAIRRKAETTNMRSAIAQLGPWARVLRAFGTLRGPRTQKAR
jgi:DNA-binding NarL/FixJ family response regulator